MKENVTSQRYSKGETKVVFRFPASPDAPGRARLAAENMLQDNYAELMETSLLLVSELVTNSVRHGRLGPDKYIELKIAAFANGVKIDVVDPGTGFSYQPRKGALDRVGGWGLYMVEQLSHRWGVNEGFPTTVWFELQKPSRERSYGNGAPRSSSH